MTDDRGRIKKSACFAEDDLDGGEFRHPTSVLRHLFLAGLVVIARSLYPIPFRTRPSKSSAPMVLGLKAWKSRTPPGLPRTEQTNPLYDNRHSKSPAGFPRGFLFASRHYRRNVSRTRCSAG